jgi:Cof subfamily protein (haloacid dehalogenase superfamily)
MSGSTQGDRNDNNPAAKTNSTERLAVIQLILIYNQPMSTFLQQKNIKALAVDLDGTLLGPGSVLSERTIKAIHMCMRAGIKIIITTGRAIEAAEPIRESLGAEGPMIYFNGAVVAEMPGTKIINTTLLSLEAAEFCVDLSRETGVYYQVYLPASGVEKHMPLIAESEGPEHERDMYYNHTGVLAELGDLREALRRPGLKGCVKTMFLAEPEVQAMLRPRLAEKLKDSVYIVQTFRNFLEVMDAKVSKGQGLKAAMERLSLKSEEVIAFGDEENDLPMFSVAGFSAAPANAKESVKAGADIVIGSNAEDGVAAFLEKHFS